MKVGELKESAEPVSAGDLREGEVYFAINYVDDDMLIPVMETVVFIGRNLEPGDVGQVYFQDVQSYQEGIVMAGIRRMSGRNSKLARRMK